VALGELVDRQRRAGRFSIPSGVRYAKLGPAGLASAAAWIDAWRAVHARLSATGAGAVAWIAVAYADWRRAEAPPPLELVSSAAAVGCEGFLIDTFRKDGRTLLDLLSRDELRDTCRAARRCGLRLGLAGSLGPGDFASLVEFEPNVIAVRGAACENRQRLSSVSAACVQRLKRAIAATFAITPDDAGARRR
jgi:uncharacterized protein (UPF0264 family)